MKSDARVVGAVFLVLGLVFIVHHVVFYGRVADLEDILHHEFFEAVFLSVGLTLLACSYTQKPK